MFFQITGVIGDEVRACSHSSLFWEFWDTNICKKKKKADSSTNMLICNVVKGQARYYYTATLKLQVEVGEKKTHFTLKLLVIHFFS